MTQRLLPLSLRLVAAVAISLFAVSYAMASTSDNGQPEGTVIQPQVAADAPAPPKGQGTRRPGGQQPAPPSDTPSRQPKTPFAQLLGDARRIEGLINLYQKDTKLYAELPPSVMGKDLLVAMGIARGIGKFPLVGGFTLGFGNDWIWQFRKVDDNVQIIRRNVRSARGIAGLQRQHTL